MARIKKTSVVRVKDVRIPKDYSLEKDGITQSMMSNWEQCPVAFMLSLNGWRSNRMTRTTGFGSMMHEMLDRIYAYGYKKHHAPRDKRILKWLKEFCKQEEQGMLSAKNRAEITRDRVVGYILLTEYVRHYAEDFKKLAFTHTEQEFDVHLQFGKVKVRCRGKKDARFLQGKERWIFETKTKGQINLDEIRDALAVDFQSLFYCVMDDLEFREDVQGVLYNIIRNPSHKKTQKDGSWSVFKARFRALVQKDPGHFFVRFEVPYTTKDKALFIYELCDKFREVQMLLDGKLKVFRRTTNCIKKWRCKYLDACSSGKLTAYTKGKLFAELSPEN